MTPPQFQQLPRVHRNHPEIHPPDTGCTLAPRCLTCPLPACRHDAPSDEHPTLQDRGLPRMRKGQPGQRPPAPCASAPAWPVH